MLDNNRTDLIEVECNIDRINIQQDRIGSENVDTSELYARGLRRRKKMFGEADVEKRMAAAGEFGAPLQNIINAYVYGDIWERSGLSGNIRSLVMLGITAASNKPAEFRGPCQGRAGERMHPGAGAGCAAAGGDVLRRAGRDRDQPHCRGDLWRSARRSRPRP